ncbi:MAG: hypothetical protein COZ15_04255 [Elusimicrobia bacterium CG_4_10_14_3_um_filter_49_12_50_7]|nr:MAG: hypothetical protein COS41_02105 [Elusimicrobia bacterium CG03_land_8_20_14_0_80_50_18]PIY16767.1 MAG: hypothetical protein COZ15_04255 [Elusimicrobia bacterium CG_4_10_14_3_um_filter_49_12_50_7]
MSHEEKKVFACGDKIFCSLFSAIGASTAEWKGDERGVFKKMEDEKGAFFIFSQSAFDGLKKKFRERFAGAPYIVFPLPGEDNRIEKEVAELVKIAVGVEM